MTVQRIFACAWIGLFLIADNQSSAFAQTAFPAAKSVNISEKQRAELTAKLDTFRTGIERHKRKQNKRLDDPRLLADVEVYAKAAEWILRHNEFFRPNTIDQSRRALETGIRRLTELEAESTVWAAMFNPSWHLPE